VAGGGALYATVLTENAGSSPQASLLARRLSDGTQLWQQSLSGFGALLGADPIAAYIASQVPGADQEAVQARRASDGQSLWSVTIPGDFAGGSPVPVLSDGVLYVSSLMKQPTGTQFQLTAVAASDGHTLWSAPLPGQFLAPLLISGTLYTIGLPMPATPTTTAPSPMVLALRPSDGSMLWQHPFATSGQAASPIGLVPCGGGPCAALTVESAAGGPPTALVAALDSGSGAELWHATIGNQVSGVAADATAIYTASLAYSPSPQPTSSVTAYRVADGKQLWTQALTNGIAKGDLKVTNGTVYLPVIAGPTNGSSLPTSALEALRAADGSVLWSVSVVGPVTSCVAASA
jgi:outer membrane protein assembly factor BamB